MAFRLPRISAARLFSGTLTLAPAALVLAVAAALLVLTGCSNQSPRRRDTLNYPNLDEPRRLDPAFVKDLYEGIVSGLLYDGLVVFGSGTDVKPGLAHSWEISADGRAYTFHLRSTHFSNGKVLSSADVRYSFTRVLRPETRSDRKWVLDRIDGADEVVSGTATQLRGLEAPDPLTVRITLREPYPVFLTMLAMPTAAIIPENSAGKDAPDQAFDQHPVGTGPWILERWLHDQRLEFRRNDDYWGGPPLFPRFVYHVQTSDEVQRRLFETGNFDMCQVGFTVYPAWSRDPVKSTLMTSVQELRTDFFGFMNNKPPFSDTRVRQAIVSAINRKAIFVNLQKGRGVLAHGPVPPDIPGYRPSLSPRAYDPERARTLLAEAGVKDLKLDLWYRDEALNSEIVQAARLDLEKVGVRVQGMPRDQASLRAGIHQGQPDMYLGSWTLDYPDMENAIFPPFYSGNIPRQGNGSHFSDPEVDRLILSAKSESDPQRRLAKYQKAEDAIIDRCPWVFLFHRKMYYAVQPWVRGWTPAVMYNADRFTSVSLNTAPGLR